MEILGAATHLPWYKRFWRRTPKQALLFRRTMRIIQSDRAGDRCEESAYDM
jgi:hypothetical protein